MMPLTAFSIDAMLPALPQISSDLNVQNANDRQLVVSSIFLGLAVGQVFFGPLSDRFIWQPELGAIGPFGWNWLCGGGVVLDVDIDHQSELQRYGFTIDCGLGYSELTLDICSAVG